MMRYTLLTIILCGANALKVQNMAPDMSPALDCLQRTTPNLELKYPSDAEAHFKEIHEALKPAMKDWQKKMHCYANHCGPWIENGWMQHFNETWSAQGPDGRLSTVFGPYVPIFFPWVDRWVKKRNNKDVWTTLSKLLRPDVAYITVSQNDEGIMAGEGNNNLKRFPNILVLSGGGYGHVPVPLLIKEREAIDVPMSARNVYMSFMGSMWTSPHGVRRKMGGALSANGDKNHTMKVGKGSEWQTVLAHSKFSMCPRGFGRTSFRLAETVQMHRIPVYVYSDVAWVPYADMFESFGFVAHADKVDALVQKIKTTVDDATITKMEETLRKIAPTHFTMKGMMDQISGFMTRKWGTSSDLRCQVLPATVRDSR
jgi:hypothetical protein